jgi:hypothetical protein
VHSTHARHHGSRRLWLIPVILATWEDEIRRIKYNASPGKEVLQNPVPMKKKLGVVVCTCHPSYGGKYKILAGLLSRLVWAKSKTLSLK